MLRFRGRRFYGDVINLTFVGVPTHPAEALRPAAHPLPRLLIAEDAPVERELLQSFLQQGGYVVECAAHPT